MSTVLQQENAELRRVIDNLNTDRYTLKTQNTKLAAALVRTIAAHCKDDKMFCSTCTPARAVLAEARA